MSRQHIIPSQAATLALALGTAFALAQAPAQAQSADITYTLPAADGTSGYVLTTNGSGSLSWAVGGTSVDDATNILANQVFS